MVETANLKCPKCGFVQEVEIPQDACLAFHRCKSCKQMISTPKGFCCVICAYSDKKCPTSVKK